MALFKRTNVRYVDAAGKRCRKDTPGSRKLITKSEEWHGEYRDADGIKRRVKLYANKEAAKQKLNELVKQAELGKAGLINPFAVHAKRPLAQHVADFRRQLESRGNTATHVEGSTNRITVIVDGCGFRRLSDLSASRVIDWLADQRNCGVFGVTTSNHYLSTIKSFTKWLVKDRRIGDDRLAHLGRLNANADRRIERRHLSPVDFGQFITATLEAGDQYGLSGEQRAMLYRTAAYTGLRASELASLTPASFDLEVDPPMVTVEAGFSKHRKRDELPLHPELASQLRQWLSETPVNTGDVPVVLRMDGSSDATDGPLWPAVARTMGEGSSRLADGEGGSQSGWAALPGRTGSAIRFPRTAASLHLDARSRWRASQDGAGTRPAFNHHADDGSLHPPAGE